MMALSALVLELAGVELFNFLLKICDLVHLHF